VEHALLGQEGGINKVDKLAKIVFLLPFIVGFCISQVNLGISSKIIPFK
jgi:hypothetical protein